MSERWISINVGAVILSVVAGCGGNSRADADAGSRAGSAGSISAGSAGRTGSAGMTSGSAGAGAGESAGGMSAGGAGSGGSPGSAGAESGGADGEAGGAPAAGAGGANLGGAGGEDQAGAGGADAGAGPAGAAGAAGAEGGEVITCSSLQGYSPPPANYAVRETHQGSNGTFTDRCTSDTTLEEYYCPYETRCGPGMMDCAPFPTGRVESTMYECATRCVDGACE